MEGAISINISVGRTLFIFDLMGKLQLKAFGENLFMVKIEGTLFGTHPWHVNGKVTFSIWILISIHIDHSFGDEDATPKLPAVDVGALFRAEIGDVRNWVAELPAATQSLVTLRPGDGTEVLLHPLGTLTIVQRVTPLGIAISRFGDARPQGQTQFTIDGVSIAGASASLQTVQEPFARAQFIEMTKDEKLAAPAFERMSAGVRIGAAELSAGPGVEISTDYTTLIWDDSLGTAVPDQPYTMKATPARGPRDHRTGRQGCRSALERRPVQSTCQAGAGNLIEIRNRIYRRSNSGAGSGSERAKLYVRGGGHGDVSGREPAAARQDPAAAGGGMRGHSHGRS